MDFGGIFQSALRSALGPDAASYAFLAVGLNMQFGHAGLANFGQVGFMLLAAYGVGASVATFGWSLWVGIAVGLGLCVLFALLLGIPTLKLRSDYFAITTIAAAEILRLMARSTSAVDLTGGPYGLQGISDQFLRLNPWVTDDDRTGLGALLQNLAGPWALWVAAVLTGVVGLSLAAAVAVARSQPPSTARRAELGAKTVAAVAAWVAVVLAMGHWAVNDVVFTRLRFLQTQYWTMVVAWTLVAVASVVVALLMSSPWGRVIRSIREDEDVASSVGKNVFVYKLQALVIGGVIGGLAGVMSALGNSTVNNQTFIPLVTFFAYTALIVGGVGSRVGPVVGAMLFWFTFRTAQSTLSELNNLGWLPDFLGGSGARGALAAVLMGLLLMAITAFRPQGIFGKREDMVFGG